MEGRRKRRDVGRSRRRVCQSARQRPPRIGACDEARLAWPQASSPSGHLCKPSRSAQPHVAPFPAPRWYSTDTRRRKPGIRSRTPLRRSCSSARSGCCSLPSGRCRAGCSRRADIRRAAALGTRARRWAGAAARRPEVGGWSRRSRADSGAFRRSGRARGALRGNALAASWSSSHGAERALRQGRSRRRSTARTPPRFFALV